MRRHVDYDELTGKLAFSGSIVGLPRQALT